MLQLIGCLLEVEEHAFYLSEVFLCLGRHSAVFERLRLEIIQELSGSFLACGFFSPKERVLFADQLIKGYSEYRDDKGRHSPFFKIKLILIPLDVERLENFKESYIAVTAISQQEAVAAELSFTYHDTW